MQRVSIFESYFLYSSIMKVYLEVRCIGGASGMMLITKGFHKFSGNFKGLTKNSTPQLKVEIQFYVNSENFMKKY